MAGAVTPAGHHADLHVINTRPTNGQQKDGVKNVYQLVKTTNKQTSIAVLLSLESKYATVHETKTTKRNANTEQAEPQQGTDWTAERTGRDVGQWWPNATV